MSSYGSGSGAAVYKRGRRIATVVSWPADGPMGSM